MTQHWACGCGGEGSTWKKSRARTPVQKFAVLINRQDGPITGGRQISAHQLLAYDAMGAESPLLGEELPTGRVPAHCPTPSADTHSAPMLRIFAQIVMVRVKPDPPNPPSGAALAKAERKTQAVDSRKQQHPRPTGSISLPSHQPTQEVGQDPRCDSL